MVELKKDEVEAVAGGESLAYEIGYLIGVGSLLGANVITAGHADGSLL
jgi:hypothetical protein